MHALLRDTVDVYDYRNGRLLNKIDINNVRDRKAHYIVSWYGYENMWYSFGTTHPGALTLKNTPRQLQNLSIPFFRDIDLAATDIIRDRERGVPRYNQFRRSIRLKPINQFEDLFRRFESDPITSDQQQLANQLRELYRGDIEKLDLLIGCLAESIRPQGYGFGETAFQIFTLMASRRLLSDRFFTVDFRPEIYTPEGIQIVQTRTMKNIIEDHFPKLNRVGLIPENAFKPWQN